MRIYANARVHTLKSPTDTHEAILVDAGKVVAVGRLAQLRERAPGAPEVDCGGQVLIPGLIDAHIHALSTAATLDQVDLSSARTLSEAVDLMVTHEKMLGAGQWLRGGKWDANRWSDVDAPDRKLLDELIPDRPVAVWSVDLHTLWLNGAALDEVGIDDDTPDPRGGRIVRDESGRATGVLREDAATIAERQFPVVPLAERVELLNRAQREWLAQGITGVHDFDGKASREAWEGLIRSDQLLLKVVKYLRLDEWDWAKKAGWRTGDRINDRFIKGGLKLFSDGALGSQTCHMCHPFPQPRPDGSANYGLPIASQDVLVDQIMEAYTHGIGVAIHAIGDQANRDVLRALQRTQGQAPVAPRVEHVQFIQESDIELMAGLGAVASMQPRHCISDIPLLPIVANNPGLIAYPWKQCLESQIPLAFGSDAPVEPTTPWAAIYAAVTRADIGGDRSTSFQPDNRISVFEALVAHTSGAAHAAGLEGETGLLAEGLDADFIVIDSDPFVPTGDSDDALFEVAESIRDTTVQLTVTAGEEFS